jgi:hypothetical protein
MGYKLVMMHLNVSFKRHAYSRIATGRLIARVLLVAILCKWLMGNGFFRGNLVFRSKA